MRLFLSTNYRDFIASALARERKSGRKHTSSALATAAGIQPAYFSNVLKGRGDFNADQLYLILDALQVTREEREFGLLLLEFERATAPARKRGLRTQIEEARDENLKTEKALSAVVTEPINPENSLYYLDPYHQLVHVALGIARYARDPALLGQDLGLSSKRLQAILKTLSQLGFAEENTTHGWKRKNEAIHLPQDSPLCTTHQSAIRQLSLAHVMKQNNLSSKCVSVTFSADPQAKQRIEELFLRFLRTCEKQVGTADSKALYQLNFDLFAW